MEPDFLLTRREVERRVALSCSTIYEGMARGTFPKPLKVGVKAVRWRSSEIDEWLSSRSRAFALCLDKANVNAVPHGFRSTFRDWVIEQTATPWAVGETALAHRLGNSTESAYARTDLFDRRRELMQQWANFLGKGGCCA